MNESIVRLTQTRDLPDGELLALISGPEWEAELAQAADAQRRKWYGTDVYVRGLIEFTNYCKNDCYYCGIRKSNGKADRYRLTEAQILDCCRQGWALGFRTFVLQGGEDPWYTDERICHIVRAIKRAFPACAVTLSIGEKERESYAAYRAAGADRYLLRHETASDDHYRMLHPASLSLEHRKNCLFTLKELGYQVGSGFMVGSPGQRPEH
ncbi:MAG: [FeFe] hydrogenase H-cluster radical SAM maturase HydE, partial [Clostridiales bacterium]|nr:[FeFe] hydrogenase H-cluster radical SAM maturase HydE [Clostridiales bacterium]